MDKKALVLYHGGCADGFGAAWVARKVFGKNADYLPVQYGDGFPVDLDMYGDVFILDFSYPGEMLLQAAEDREDDYVVTVLDHHKTAQEDLADMPQHPRLVTRFDMERSGAMITWDWFFRGAEPPPIIKYVQDRDLWRDELPGSREYTYALRSYPLEFDAWDLIETMPVTDMIRDGTGIRRYCEEEVRRAIEPEKRLTCVLRGYTVEVVNVHTLFSEVAQALCYLEGNAFGAAFRVVASQDGRKALFSLRSVDGFDVSEIARHYGGGGHKHAAGCSIPLEQIEFVKTQEVWR